MIAVAEARHRAGPAMAMPLSWATFVAATDRRLHGTKPIERLVPVR